MLCGAAWVGRCRRSGCALNMARKKATIRPSKIGSLRAIARRDKGLRRDGKISKTWARKKLSSPRTSGAVKRKLQFFLNFNR